MTRLTRAYPRTPGEVDASSGAVKIVDDDRVYVAEGEIIAGKYRVDRVLGVGGVGFVVAATHLELGGHFALKFLKRRVLVDKTIVERFTREAKAACRLKSEFVARVYDVGMHEDAPFIVMEHLVGRDLAAVLAERGALPAAEAILYVVEACAALAVAHADGIVHRDIKPENLFLVEHEGVPTIKLLDFGISKFLLQAPPSTSGWSEGEAITGTLTCGTPSYMSPEQIRSTASVDARSDVWSLGVVLYELLAAEPAFDGESATDVCSAILEREPRRLRDLHPDLAPGLSEIVEGCLQKDPSDRIASVAELAVALLPFAPPRALAIAEGSSWIRRAAIHALGGSAEVRVSAGYPVEASSARFSVASPATRLSAPPSIAPRERRGWTLALSVAAVSIAAFGAYRVLGAHESVAPAPAPVASPPAVAPTVVAPTAVAPTAKVVDEPRTMADAPATASVGIAVAPSRIGAPARARVVAQPPKAPAIPKAAPALAPTGSPPSSVTAAPVFIPPVPPGRPDLGY
jgi:serine/threonine protein kinase